MLILPLKRGIANNLFHCRLGRLGSYAKTYFRGLGIPIDCSSCDACNLNKLLVHISSTALHSALYSVGEKLHVDVCGPISTSATGESYFLTIVDDASRYIYCYPIKSTKECASLIITVIRLVLNQNPYGNTVKILQSDNGSEFVNHRLLQELNLRGIHHNLSGPHHSYQNGLAERTHRSIKQVARTLLHQAGAPFGLWSEAVSTATYIFNILPRKFSSDRMLPHKTPYENLLFSGFIVLPHTSTSPISRMQLPN